MVGAGLAGLAAAGGRCCRTRNCPGFPEGIARTDLLQRLRRQAKAHGVAIAPACVDGLDKRGGSFRSATHPEPPRFARDPRHRKLSIRPPDTETSASDRHASIRLCPVCDAFEAKGKRIGVIGNEHLALFLRDSRPHVAMLFNYPTDVPRAIATRRAGRRWDAVEDLVIREPRSVSNWPVGTPARQLDHLSCNGLRRSV